LLPYRCRQQRQEDRKGRTKDMRSGQVDTLVRGKFRRSARGRGWRSERRVCIGDKVMVDKPKTRKNESDKSLCRPKAQA